MEFFMNSDPVCCCEKNTLVKIRNANRIYTQVNRMYRSRRVLAIGGKQRIFGLDMVCIETILFHLESF